MKIPTAIKIFTSQLARQFTLVFTGNIIAAGLGFLSVLIISKTLTVNDFGLFNIAISIMLIAPYLASLGMDTSIIKFSSSYLGANKSIEANEVLRVALFIRIIVSLFLSISIFITANTVSTKLFHYPDLSNLLKLASFGVLSISILNCLKSMLYANKLYKNYVLLQVLIDVTKLSGVIILILFLKISAISSVAIFTIAPAIGVLLGFKKLRHKLISKRKPIKNLISQLFSYSKWTFISEICNRAFYYLGLLLLARMLTAESAGIYGLALNLAYIFPILIASLRVVLLPEVSRFRQMAQFENYIKQSLKISLYVASLSIPFLFLSKKIIPFIFGMRYLDSVTVFNWLLLSYLADAMSNPIRQALYSLHKPKVVSLVDLVKITAMFLGCYILIPSFGAVVPAIAALIINTFTLGFCIMYIFLYMEKGKNSFPNEKCDELSQ